MLDYDIGATVYSNRLHTCNSLERCGSAQMAFTLLHMHLLVLMHFVKPYLTSSLSCSTLCTKSVITCD